MSRRQPPRSPLTYTAWAVIAATIGVLDIIVGLSAVYAVIMFLLTAWWLLQVFRSRAAR